MPKIKNGNGKIRTTCQGCHCECGVIVDVRNGRIRAIRGDTEHPINEGFICIKGARYADFVCHPDRLTHPLKRAGNRGEGKWTQISWTQALDEISARLTRIKEEYGSEAIATIDGTGPRSSLFSATLLPYVLGSPNLVNTNLHICYAPSLVAEVCTLGASVMMEAGPDYKNARCILLWGANPLASHPPRGMEVLAAVRKKETKLIVIDPRRTYLASKAHVWLQIRPGTDAALALAMLNTIISEKLFDEEFVSKWCYGFDQLKHHIKEYSAERAAEITWISAERIRETARLYATSHPAVLHHRVAIEHNVNSVQTNRALCMMVSLTGNIDIKGGNLLPMYPKGYVHSGSILGGSREFRPNAVSESKRLGAKNYPLISGPEAVFPFVHPAFLLEAIESGKPYPVKALFCAGANPVLNIQDSTRVWEALKRLELLIVVDFFMTPAGEIADYVLPATMWPERNECCDLSYTNYIAARQKAVDPPGECWDDLKIAIELVKRITWAERKYLPWDSVEEFNDWRLRGLGLNFDEFKRKRLATEPINYRKYEKTGFSTPTGKVELYSTTLEAHGYDPLPVYVEPPESPFSAPELAGEYPYVLITGGRYVEYFHSEGRQIASLRKRIPDPEVEINLETAKRLHIRDGNWVWLETPQMCNRRVRFKARLTSTIDPRVVHAAHAWWFPEKPGPEHGCFDSNPNVVLSIEEPREPVCGSTRTRGTLCRIYR